MKKIAFLIIVLLFTNSAETGDGQSDDDKNLELWCEKGNFDKVKRLIESDVQLEDRGFHWGNTLRIACIKGHLDIVKYLVGDKKANLQMPPIDSDEFQKKCADGDMEAIQYLVDHKVNAEDTMCLFKRSSLHVACINRHIKIIHYLADHGANFESQDIHKKTPYDYLNAEDKHSLRIHKNEAHDPRKLLLIGLGHKYDEHSTLRLFPDDIINEIRSKSIHLGLLSAQAKIWKPVHASAHILHNEFYNTEYDVNNEKNNLARIVYSWPEETKKEISAQLLKLQM